MSTMLQEKPAKLRFSPPAHSAAERAAPSGIDHPSRTDEELARLGRAGVEVLFRRHHAALYRFCLSLTRQADEAADATQTMWERAMVTFSKDGGSVLKVRPWLYTVARNECHDRMRARGSGQLVDLGDLELVGGVSPEETYEQRAEVEVLLRDLRGLSERQRSAVVLREVAGLEPAQLASALGTSQERALGLVAEGRRGLRERRTGRGLPCASAQRELIRMRRRSTRVQAHLESCADCQSFERGRRGRSLSSLAISPLLYLGGLVKRLSGLASVPQAGITKVAIATTVAAGSFGLASVPFRHHHRAPQAPSRTLTVKVAGSDQRAPAPRRRVRASGAVGVLLAATRDSDRRAPRVAAPPRSQARPPALATPPPATPEPPAVPAPAPAAPATSPPPAPAAPAPPPLQASVNVSLPATGVQVHAAAELAADVSAPVVDHALATTQSVGAVLQAVLQTAAAVVPQALSTPR